MAIYPDIDDWMNQVGYQYMRLKDLPAALEVFRLNVSLFPDSWNVYDSYGEALLANGDDDAAISNYRKALKLNPESNSAREKLKELIRE